MFGKLIRVLREPAEYFEAVRSEGALEALGFLLSVSAMMAVLTPLVNYLGWPSTDLSASLQAQILAWRATETYLLPRLGGWAYVAEALLIVLLAVALAGIMSVFIHLLYRLLGGKGPLLNAWKGVCYGVGPCVLLGWVPYWSLFVATWSLILQFYYAPKVLYRMREGRSVAILAFVVGATLLEFATKGTTVGFGPR